MKNTTLLFITLYLIGIHIHAQKEASNWYFGFNSGVNFDLNSNTTSTLNNSEINTFEGCASISNDNGDLLFYTDGITVWNKNHNIMSNATDLFGAPSSTQSAIIIPKPNDENIYYVFTVDDRLEEEHHGLNYSIIDITLDSGLGEVTSKNTNLLPFCSEKITAVQKDCITGSIWVLTFSSEDGESHDYNTFHAYEVSETGINATPVSTTFNTNINDPRGYLKFSPDGTKIASANALNGLYIYNFDTLTGTVSNERFIPIDSPNNIPYGVEFSPNSNLLYVCASNDFAFFNNTGNSEILSNYNSKLIQYNLLAPNIEDSAYIVDERQLYRSGLQLGPNGKIYRALSLTLTQGSPFLGAIENPNRIGAACNYNHNAINLSPFNSSQGLPPFITSFFNTEIDIIKNGKSTINLDVCLDNISYNLKADDITGASYFWTLDNKPLAETSAILEIFSPGHYQVIIEPTNNGGCTIEGQAFVNFVPNPDAFNHTLIQCGENDVTLFNLNEANIDLTGGIEDRSTKFYTDIARINEVDGNNFTNETNPQTIYVKVINNKTECSSFSELTLQVNTTLVGNVELINCDSDNFEDGLYNFDLTEANTILFETLPIGLNISYYETFNNALLEKDFLDLNYINTTPYSQTIFARIENDNNCYSISKVLLTVNRLPNIETEDLSYYCLNDFPNKIIIDAGPIDNANNYNYEWSNSGDTTYQIETNEIGIHTVTITNIFGCTKKRTIRVEASNIATFSTPAFNIIDASENNTITVFVTGDGTYQYSLVDEDNNTIKPYQDSPFFENVFPGIYTVLVKDIKNDCGIVQKDVSVIGFPKFFTPNNDGVNDTWQIIGVSELFQPNSKIYIYNRYGKLLKEFSPISKGWNGKLNGTILPADDYWFSVKLQDGRIYKNHFTLKH